MTAETAAVRAASAARSVASQAHRAASRVHRAASRDGADSSGLTGLIYLNAVQSAGDALIAVFLAGTIFFSLPVGEARGKVALYLLLTMAPFALVAPVIGPLLDRVRRGRRGALAATMAGRAICAWVLAGAGTGFALFPAAFAVLVLSKAYGVTKSACLPRVLPPRVQLVSANARMSLAGTLAAVVAAPIGAGIAWAIGPGWLLRAAVLVFLGAVLLASRLPSWVEARDEDTGPLPAAPADTAAMGQWGPASEPETIRIRRPSASGTAEPETVRLRRRGVPAAVIHALRAAVAVRGLNGFLTIFLAFMLRTHGSGTLGLGALAAAYGVGSFLGNVAGTRLPARPEWLLTVVLVVATAACAVGAVLFSVPFAIGVVFVAAMAGAVGKLALDSIVQRETGEEARASTFARSETALQLCWVLGGALGIAPVSGTIGFSFAAVVLAASLVLVLRARSGEARGRRRPRLA